MKGQIKLTQIKSYTIWPEVCEQPSNMPPHIKYLRQNVHFYPCANSLGKEYSSLTWAQSEIHKRHLVFQCPTKDGLIYLIYTHTQSAITL